MKNTRFSTLFFLIGVICSQALEPGYFPENSTFNPSNANVKTLGIIDSIRVFTGNQAGRDRVIQLKSKGYNCEPALSNLWRCTNHLENWNHEANKVKRRINNEVSKLEPVNFGRTWNELVQTHESYAYNEWEMRQNMKIGDYQLEYYRFRKLQGTDFLKLLPGQQGFKQEYLWNENGFSKVVEFSISHSEGYTRYLMQIPYDRN